jgi:hypothetical protein
MLTGNLGTFRIIEESYKVYGTKPKKIKYLKLQCENCGNTRQGTLQKFKKNIECEQCKLLNDFVGNTYGKLKVLSSEGTKNTDIILHCQCDCGTLVDIPRINFVHTKHTSCNKCAWSKFNYYNDFFKTLTSESAYILGFLYSDGNLTKNRNSFQITQHKNEEYLLKVISSYIREEYQVIDLKGTNLNRIVFNNQILYNDLLSWGLYPNKSSSIVVHEDLKLNKDFWRGMIDGDGCLNLNKNSIRLIMYGTENICTTFKSFCEQVLGENLLSNVLEDKRNYSFKFCSFTVSGQKAIKVLDCIYENKSDLYMERKYQKYLNFKNK